MKRYLTLLTLIFLSTSTLVNAGKINILDLPENLEDRRQSLTAKAVKLQQNIEGTQDETLIQAFRTQHGVIMSLVNTPLAEQNYDGYFDAQEQIDEIKANFLKKALTGELEAQCDKIRRVLDLGIYAYQSQEFDVLQRARYNIRDLGSRYYNELEKLKVVGRYLKMEKLVNDYIQSADIIIEGIMAEAHHIRSSDLLVELEGIQDTLGYGSENYELVNRSLRQVSVMQTVEDESEIMHAVLEYRDLKEKLEPLLCKYRELKQETPSLVLSILSGQYTELERELSRRPFYSNLPETDKIEDFLRIMREVRRLPGLFSRFKEVEQAALKGLDALKALPSVSEAQIYPFQPSFKFNFDQEQEDFDEDHEDSDEDFPLIFAQAKYEKYFKEEFLPQMGESCRKFNTAPGKPYQKTNEEILAILFPDLPKGTYPDRETATRKFAELARNGRPYAKLFNPPSDM